VLRGQKVYLGLRTAPSRRGSLMTLRLRRPAPPEPCGYGMAVSARVGGAVVRNRVKRRLRVILRRLFVAQPALHRMQVMIQAAPAAARAPQQTLNDELDRLLASHPLRPAAGA